PSACCVHSRVQTPDSPPVRAPLTKQASLPSHGVPACRSGGRPGVQAEAGRFRQIPAAGYGVRSRPARVVPTDRL
ncbi:unnamed protein product, partial [Urochloa humidicola]